MLLAFVVYFFIGLCVALVVCRILAKSTRQIERDYPLTKRPDRD